MDIAIKTAGMVCLALALVVTVDTTTAANAGPDGRKIVSSIEARLWGHTSEGEYGMTITTPHWSRTLQLKSAMQRPSKTFVRILSPKKEAGIGSLRIKNEMWNYLPKIERVIKIPPSMMLQPWMGSDFTNDDLVKESSMVDDYVHHVDGVEENNGVAVYRIVSVPKPDAAVVWGKLVYRVRKSDLMPLSQQYFDERGELIKELVFSDFRQMGGREIPTRWTMQPANKPGSKTEIRIHSLRFDRPIAPSTFTLRNLRRSR